MEVRSFEKNSLQIVENPKDYPVPGTSCVLSMVKLTPRAWIRIQHKTTKEIAARNGRPKRQIVDEEEARRLVYEYGLKAVRGLTKRIANEVFLEDKKIGAWESYPDDEEVVFSDHAVMLQVMTEIGSNSSRLHNFIWSVVVPTNADMQEEEETSESEKKIS